MSYCDYTKNLPNDNLHKIYHDTQYGFPINNDNELFGRLILEINQAGLSWDTILKKQENFRKAYDNFNIKKIAKYTEKDINRLLNDSGIIRNRIKINAAVFNAYQIIKIQKKYGSFLNWIQQNKKENIIEYVKLFKSEFKFVGGEIVNEFLMSIGELTGAHDKTCRINKAIAKSVKQ